MQAISDLLLRTSAIGVTTTIAERFGEVRAQQFASGQFTPEMDLLIAFSACPDMPVGGKPVDLMIYEP